MSDINFIKRINKAIKRADIRKILNIIGIKFKEKSFNDLWFRCVMTYHLGEKDASVHISANPTSSLYGLWKCFGCNSSGNIIHLVKYGWNISFIEALILVENNQCEFNEDIIERKEINVTLPLFYTSPQKNKWDKNYLDYLLNRGITWKQIKQHKIGYVDAGQYINRIIIPVYLNHKLTTFIARTILSDCELRVTSAYGGKPGLFGSELANPKYGPAIISEGWADALAIERAGYVNSMSIQTNLLYDTQFEFLMKFPYIILFPDGDNGGNQFIDSCAQYIDQKDFFVVNTPRNKDPDEINPDDIIELIGSAKEWEPTKEIREIEIEF